MVASLQEICLQKISAAPAREGVLSALPPHLTDKILHMVLRERRGAETVLALRLWKSLGLAIHDLTIFSALVDERLITSMNAFKCANITFVDCEFDVKERRGRKRLDCNMLELCRAECLSFVGCRWLSGDLRNMFHKRGANCRFEFFKCSNSFQEQLGLDLST